MRGRGSVEFGHDHRRVSPVPTQPNHTTLADALRDAIRDSALSYNELARLAKADQGTISRFMLGLRDLTLAVASRLCLVLGFGLTQVGAALTEPLEDPPKSNRKKSKKRPPPASAVRRGQGRRVDLEQREAEGDENTPGESAETNSSARPRRGRRAGSPPGTASRSRKGSRKG